MIGGTKSASSSKKSRPSLFHLPRIRFKIVIKPFTLDNDPMVKAHKLADGRFECQNCLKKFSRNKKTYIDPKFCSDDCRKEFHYNGGFSLKRIESKVRQWVRDELRLVKEESAI